MTRKQILDAIASGQISVKSLEECAKAELHLCGSNRLGKDDVEGVCSECGKPIFFSTVFPAAGPQPRRVCIPCGATLVRGEQALAE